MNKTRTLTVLLLLNLSVSAVAQSTPTWPLEVLSWNIDKAYPGVKYEYRPGVRGGTYPYTFSLTQAPEEMSIDINKGTITWTPQTESNNNPVKISITDSKGDVLEHQFTIDVTKSRFRFVASNGSDTSDGTEAKPWASIKHAIETATNANYIYVKEGTYPVADAIHEDECGKFLAWPGDSVTLLGTATVSKAQIWLTGPGNYIFQGFHCDAGDNRWFFNANTDFMENVIIRKNHLYNVYSDDKENPAFLFFTDGNQTPVNGQEHYKNIVVQENIFNDLRNAHIHGASLTLYDVQDLLYEDNMAYDIDGRGINDKDDGYRNTIRNNIIYNCNIGISLLTQNTESTAEINYNLVYNCENEIQVISQPGYLKDAFIHHNTIVGFIIFGYFLNNGDCSNINVYNNIIGDGVNYPYQFYPIKVKETEGGSHYEYPYCVGDTTDSVLFIDNNLVWAPDANKIAGYSWGIPEMGISQWNSALFDRSGIFETPALNASYGLSETDPYYGIYGRDHEKHITTAIETAKEKQDLFIKLFPNPANSTLVVAGESGTECQGNITLYTSLGEKVYQTPHAVSLPFQVDVSSFAPDLYFLKVVSNHKCLTQKVIIN